MLHPLLSKSLGCFTGCSSTYQAYQGEPLTEERAFWLAWSQIHGIGPILIKRLHRHFSSLAAAWEASPKALQAVEGFGLQLSESAIAARRQIQPEDLLQQHQQKNPRFWTPADPDYPRLLLEIPDPPPVLYYRGNVVAQENSGGLPTVAIVGTRSPSEYGKRWTRRLSTALAKNGFIIISGLAEGIDTEAHRSCLEAGGRTLAVLGTGLDIVYPWSNRSLYKQVIEQGLALSEYPAGTQADRAHFPRRNRIVAGLSRAVLVLEAPERSGALITVHLANDYGRDVYVLPGSLDNPRAIGCLHLLNTGAQVILGEDHLLELLGAMPQLSLPLDQPANLPGNLPPELTQILQGMTELNQTHTVEAVSFDLLVQTTGLTASALSSSLLQLELMGLVTQQPGMRYQRS